jgi:PIN domain nuclease of toxin-antitoxin system
MYLLDTHVFFWRVAEPSKLSETQNRLLDRAEEDGEAVGLSAISLWELAMHAQRGRIEPPKIMDLRLGDIESDPRVVILPLTGRIAAEAVGLAPEVPADPVDRIIIATARCHGLPLLTADRRIREAGVVAVI